jgi:ribosome recycling factor
MSFDFSPLETSLDKAIDHTIREVSSLRTGRASAQLLDPVMVEAYGTRMKLVEVASIQAPDPTLLMVSPWDKSLMHAVEKAIASADLNLNPVVDGEIIRIAVPSLTEETRKEMVKSLHRKIENGRVMVRNTRADFKRDIEEMKGSDGVSEDDISADIQSLEEKVKKAIERLEELQARKEKELMTV